MTFSSHDTGSGVASELVDLGAISLPELRNLVDASLHRALQHVVRQAANIRMAPPSGSSEGGERVD